MASNALRCSRRPGLDQALIVVRKLAPYVASAGVHELQNQQGDGDGEHAIAEGL
jgi:hypothetical protein